MDSVTCKKCGVKYDDPSEGFYWETRKCGWRKPCKTCISDYNKSPKRYKKKLKYNREFRKRKREEIKNGTGIL